jgi:hypothetical protein
MGQLVAGEHARHDGARLGSTRLVTVASLAELPSGPIDGLVIYRRMISPRSQVFSDLARYLPARHWTRRACLRQMSDGATQQALVRSHGDQIRPHDSGETDPRRGQA